MGKMPDPPKPEKKPAPVTPESADVKKSGQKTVDEVMRKKGRMSTLRGGAFGSIFGNKTGDV